MLLAGDGWNRDSLKRLANTLGISSRVSFLGTRSDIPDLLSACDIFVFPSLYEGLPGALIEAMLAGKPVIASDILEVREVIQPGFNGTLCNPSDAPSLADALLSLATDLPRQKRYAKNAQEMAVRQYDIDNVVRDTEMFYENTIKRR